MATPYIPLAVSADLSVASLLEAVRLAGDQPTYELHVNPAQVSAAQNIALHFEPALPISVVGDSSLQPTEWFAYAPRVSVAFGSVGP